MGLDSVTTVLAVRHGETAWNRESRIQGHLDIPLSPLGLAQAQRLAQALAGEPLDAIYASDLQRAQAGVMDYLVQMGVDLRLMTYALRTPPAEINVLEPELMAELGLTTPADG